MRAPGLQIWNNATAAAQKQLTNIVTREISTLLLSVIQNPGSIVNQCMASLKGMQVGGLHHTPPWESRTGLHGALQDWSLISGCGETPAWAQDISPERQQMACKQPDNTTCSFLFDSLCGRPWHALMYVIPVPPCMMLAVVGVRNSSALQRHANSVARCSM